MAARLVQGYYVAVAAMTAQCHGTSQLRQCMNNTHRWNRWVAQLARCDGMYGLRWLGGRLVLCYLVCAAQLPSQQ